MEAKVSNRSGRCRSTQLNTMKQHVETITLVQTIRSIQNKPQHRNPAVNRARICVLDWAQRELERRAAQAAREVGVAR